MSLSLTLRRSWLPVLSGVVAGLSPHTSSGRVVPSVVGGLLVAGALLGWQRWTGARAPVPLCERGRVWHLLPLGLTVVAFLPTLVFLYEIYTDSIWENGHGLLLPILLSVFAGRILAREAAPVAIGEDASLLGFGFLVAGVGCALVDAVLSLGHLGAIGLVLVLPGFSLLYLGADVTRRLTPVFLLALFLIPVPTPFAHWVGLPETVALVAQDILQWFGFVVAKDGVLLYLREIFAVSDRCSGIAAFVGGCAMASFVVLTTRARWRWGVAVLLPWPLTVFWSAVRVAILLGFAGEGDMRVIEAATHGLSGIAVFWLVVLTIACFVDHRALRERLG